MLENIRYFVRRALRNMRQWPLLCSAAVLTMAVALATVASFFLVVLNIEQLAASWTQEVQVVAYLEKSPKPQELPGLLQTLQAFPELETARFVSQDEALKRFRKRLGEDASLLEGVDRNILPASFELGLKKEFRNQKGIDQVIKRLESTIEVDELRYGQQWLERFNTFVDMLRFVGMVLGGFLLFAALFIVSNTIKLTLYARRDELEIMALVGATMRFIKIPFLLEGALQGFAGGLLALVFLAGSFKILIEQSIKSFWLTPANFELLFLSFNQQLGLVAAGVLLGSLGSLTSLRRFVRI